MQKLTHYTQLCQIYAIPGISFISSLNGVVSLQAVSEVCEPKQDCTIEHRSSPPVSSVSEPSLLVSQKHRACLQSLFLSIILTTALIFVVTTLSQDTFTTLNLMVQANTHNINYQGRRYN